MVDDMMKKGVIEESDSPWTLSVVPIKKKNGKLCFCIDYRKLNNVRKDFFPLPWIDDARDISYTHWRKLNGFPHST